MISQVLKFVVVFLRSRTCAELTTQPDAISFLVRGVLF